jgi:hypothetical protein
MQSREREGKRRSMSREGGCVKEREGGREKERDRERWTYRY